MADTSTYPLESDLQALIESTGVIDISGQNFLKIDLVAKIEAAVDEWEEATGWFPFLGDAQDSTRRFDPPGPTPGRTGLSLRGGGRKLFLGAGLLSLTSLTIGGFALQEGVSFWLRPDNAPAKKKPYTRIDFAAPVFSSPQGVVITGTWGYWSTCRSSVWQAILQRAAALCVPELALNISQGVFERREGDEMMRFGGSNQSPLSAEAAMWNTYFAQTAEDYDRLGL